MVGDSAQLYPFISFVGNVCGEVITLAIDSPMLGHPVLWNTGATGDTIEVDGIVGGTFIASISDTVGCVFTDTVNVLPNNWNPQIGVSGDACNLGSIAVLYLDSLTSAMGTYLWSTGSTGDTVHVVIQKDSVYSVTVTRSDQCSKTAGITIGSQCACISGFDSLIVIAQDTLASQLSIPVGSNVYVGDSVTITVDTLWVLQQCEVVLGSAAEIVVTAAGELNVRGSYLHACDTMWQGIALQPGSLMLSQEQGGTRSVIEDAVIAILSNNGAVLHARRTDFINDRMGIIIADGGAYAGTVGLCDFKHASPGLKPPYSGKRTLSGIYMHHTSSWSVPVSDTMYNTFTGINNGISGYRNFEMHVNRNMFTDIRQYEGCTLPSCVAVDWNSARLGCAVFLSSDLHLLSTTPAIPMGMGQASVSNSRFRNCFKGVKASSLTIGVTQDTMTNMTYGVDISKTWYRLIAVGHNVMDTVSYGISLKNNVGSSEQVYYNQIRVRPIPTSVPLGISSLAGGTQIIPVVPVAEDYFAVKSANGPSPTFASDIYFNALRHGRNTVELESPGYRTVVRNNAIYQNGTQAVPLPQKGIYVRGGEKFRIYGDTIYGLDSAGTVGSIPVSGAALSAKRKQGIFLDAAKRYEIMCNQLDSLQWGMVFQGNCDAQEAAIHENQFNYYRRGLSLQKLGQYGSIGGAIGGLDSVNSNQWNDGSSNDVNQWETYVSTDNFTQISLVTRLYWANGQLPLNFDNQSNINGSEILPVQAHIGAIEAEDCNLLNGLRMAHIFDTLDYAIAADTFEFNDFAEVSKWRYQRDLYAKIMEAYALDTLTDTSLISFANADPRDGVRQSVRYAAAMQLLSDSSLASDSLGVANLLSDAYKVLDSLPDEPSYVRNVKETGKLLIRVMARGEADLDSSELVYVETLAFSCPYVEGDGVYTARYIYGLVADTTYYIDDMLLCTEDTMQAKWEGEEPKNRFAANEERNIGSLQLVPNPAKDMVTVIYSLQPNEKALLSLYSLTGQAVIQKELVGTGKVDLNLLHLPSGLYTYKAVGNIGSIYSGKLIIAK